MVTPEITPANAAAARACALAVVRRVFEEDAWADRALHGEAQAPSGWTAATARSPRGSPTAPSSARPRWTRSPRSSPRRPVERLDPAVRAALRLGPLPARLPGPRARPRGRRRRRRARQARLAGRRPSSSTPCCAARRRWPRAGSRALPDAHAGRGRAAPLLPELDRRAVVRRARPGRRARADGRAQRARGGRPARQHAADRRRRSSPARLGVPSHPAPGLPEGLVLDAPFDAFESPLWARGPLHAAVARRDGRRPRARAAARRARARPVRRARAARRRTSPR